MKKELKKKLLETLLYYCGMLNVLIKNAKRKKHASYEEYIKEKNNVEYLIEEIKKL